MLAVKKSDMPIQEATLKCIEDKRPDYPEIYIYATPCDGIPECKDHIDEMNCNLEAVPLLISFLAGYLVLFCLIFVFSVQQHKRLCCDGEINIFRNFSEFSSWHDSPDKG